MKRKFVKVMFFGALALSTVTYVGCKDYDDDVKGLQEQIDTINKKGADVTTEAMKTAISSAVADLQSQLDAIAGKADKTALEELKAAVQKLQTALEGKASSEDVAALNTKLEEAIGKVDKSIADAVKVAKEQLQKEIDALKEKLDKADGKADENALKLAELEQKMLELDKASGERIAKLELQIAELEGIKTRIQNLEDASANFATMDQLDEYLLTAKGYVDTKMLDYLTSDQVTNKVDAVKTYVDGAFKTTIFAEIKTTYLSLDSYNKDMEKLEQQMSTFVDSQSQEYKDIFVDIKTLMDYKKDVLEVLVKDLSDPNNNTIQKANDCYNALNGITDVKDELAKCAKTSDLSVYLKSADLNKKIDEHLKATFASYDSSIKEIGTKVETLTGAVKDMLKSLVFLPQEYDASGLVRKVEFISYYTTDDASTAGDHPESIGSKLISNEIETKVRFRVSPATAVDALVAENSKYTITTDKHIVKSRSVGAPFEVTGVSKVKKAESETEYEEGVIEVTLNIGSASESYAIALYVTGNDETTKLTEITSDYFAAIIGKSYVKKVTYSNAATNRGNVMYPDNKDGLPFFTAATSENDGSEYYSVTLSAQDGTSEQTPKSLDKMNIPIDLFNVTFALDGTNKDDFTLTNGLLKLKDTGVLEHKCTVTPTVTMKVGDKTASYAGDAETVTVESQGVTVEGIVLDNNQKWNSRQKSYNLQDAAIKDILKAINTATGENYAKLSDVNSAIIGAGGSVAHTADGKVDAQLNGDNVEVTVGEKFFGTASPIVKLDFGNTLKITIPVSVTVSYPDAVTLLKSDVLWTADKSKTTLVVKETEVGGAGKLQSISLERDLSTLFTNFSTLTDGISAGNYDQIKYTPSKKGENAVGAMAANTFTISDLSKATNDVSVNMSLLCTGADGSEPASKTIVNEDIKFGPISEQLTSTFETPALGEGETEITVTAGNKDAVKVIKNGFSWKDRRNAQMWPKGTDFSDNFAASISTSADALAIYGYSIKIEFVDNVSGYFEFTDDTKESVQLTTAGEALKGLLSDLKVKVKITPKVSFGAAPSEPVTVTVVYPKELFNTVKE